MITIIAKGDQKLNQGILEFINFLYRLIRAIRIKEKILYILNIDGPFSV